MIQSKRELAEMLADLVGKKLQLHTFVWSSAQGIVSYLNRDSDMGQGMKYGEYIYLETLTSINVGQGFMTVADWKSNSSPLILPQAKGIYTLENLFVSNIEVNDSLNSGTSGVQVYAKGFKCRLAK